MNARRLLLGIGLAVCAAACRPKDTGTLHLNGRLEAPLVDLAPKVAGRVVEIRVREGDRVKAGDLLARLDLGEMAVAVDRDREGVKSAQARYQDLAAGSRRPEILAAEADVADKRAQLELAKRQLDRQRALLDEKIGTQSDFDVAKTGSRQRRRESQGERRAAQAHGGRIPQVSDRAGAARRRTRARAC